MNAEFSELAPTVGMILGAATGQQLKLGMLSKKGIELMLEDDKRRTELRLMPNVYTDGKVIVDAINDLTLVLELKQYELDASGKVRRQIGESRVELPFSTWFHEGDYL